MLCQAAAETHNRPMRTRWLLLSAALLPFFHTSCGTGGGSSSASNPSGTGPFDSRGNYVEAWADNPSQWKKGRTQVVEPTPDRPAQDLASLDSGPPPDAMPLATPRTTTTTVRTTPTVSQTPPSRPRATVVASSSTKPKSRQVEVASSTRPKPRTSAGSSGSSSSASKSKTKPKSTAVAKTTTKPKPKTSSSSSSRYAVKKGDSLYAIAKRYGTTVGALQKANKMSGTSIRPGQSLSIPK